MASFSFHVFYVLSVLAAAGFPGPAQTPAPVASPPQSAVPAPTPGPVESPAPSQEPAHQGQIVIQSHGDPPAGTAALPRAESPSSVVRQPDENAKADVSDAERGAVTILSYDLDARLKRERGGLEVRARLRVRNGGPEPLRQVPLQISSSLHWESATLVDGERRTPLPLVQHRIDTDADHTGAATEVVLSLPSPLASGSVASLDLFYSGVVAENGDRLARLGAGAAQQHDADWDAISPEWTGLRGFGNVLWYPVASPQFFLADGNSLFLAIGRMRRSEQAASVRLRLAVEYEGEPPVGAYFCGRRAALHAVPDDPAAANAVGTGIASAEFATQPLGFRFPTLFLVQRPETLLGGQGAAERPLTAGLSQSPPGVSTSNPELTPPAGPGTEPTLHARPPNGRVPSGEPVLALASTDPGVAAGLGAAADGAAGLLREWLGDRPLSALTVLDHPGQPFQDGPMLVAPAATLQTSPEQPALIYSLTHAWVQTGQPWMDEGLAQFFALLSVEREHGRAAALDQLAGLLQPLTLAEPDLASAADNRPGQPIVTAPDELFYRRKAAAVWWMLRDIAGETSLKAALAAWRTQPEGAGEPEAQAIAFEHLLERLSGKDLGWLFADWVLRDRGLPDMSIAEVQTSRTPAGPGHSSGVLVAITVRNKGGAAAEVPVVVQSGHFSTTERVRVPAFSQTTQRVLVEAEPTSVTVNDGGTPELGASTHTRTLTALNKPK